MKLLNTDSNYRAKTERNAEEQGVTAQRGQREQIERADKENEPRETSAAH